MKSWRFYLTSVLLCSAMLLSAEPWNFPTDKRIQIKNIPDWGKDGFTLEIYCMPTIADGGYAVLILNSFGYPKFSKDNGFESYIKNNSGQKTGGKIKLPVEVNKYHYYALTGDKEKSVMYCNGKAVSTKKGNGVPLYITNTPLRIGHSAGWAKNNFQGKIALVRISNRALNSDEIQANFKALQENRPLAKDASVIVNEDRRITGDVHKFVAGQTASIKNVPANTMLSFTVKPEKLAESALIRWGDLQIAADAEGSVIARLGKEASKAEKVLQPNKSTTVTLAWNGKQASLFINNKPAGKLLNALPLTGKADIVAGDKFDGMIGQITVSENNILPEKLGEMVTVKLDNRSVDTFSIPLNRHLVGKSENMVPLANFDDLTGWQMSYTVGAVKPIMTRSKEEKLWSDYVLRTEFAQGDYPAKDAKVVLTPPAPIKITEDFDTVAIWRFSTAFKKPRPALNYSIQYRNSKGELCDTGNMGGMLEPGWGIHMNPLKNMVKAPAEIVSITFRGFNEARRVTYFDSLHVYKRPAGKLTDARVPSFQELGLPTTPDTIMPTAKEPGKISLKKNTDSWTFESVTPSGKKLVFNITPKTGTLSDITATYNGKTFNPMTGGGFYWALDNIYPVQEGSLLAPSSKQIKAKLQKYEQQGSKLTLYWIYDLGNKQVCPATWVLEMKNNTLIADLSSSSAMVGEFKFGAITGISGKVIELPYLNLGRWRHASNPPGIFADTENNIYVSQFVDWYNSEASGLFGASSSTPGGKFVFNLVTADHRWVADPDASDPSGTVRDTSVINGGSFYWPKTDGKRNPSRDRIMVTISDDVASVLPNIPNPKRKHLQTTAEEVWSTRMWYSKLPYMTYFDEEYAQWQECKDYGMEKLNVRLHGNINRMYVPRRDGSPTCFITSFTVPEIGGDAKLAEFCERIKKLNYRIGIYTNPMLMSPLARDAWSLDMLNLDSNGQWLYSSGNARQTKVTRQTILQKKFNELYKKMFAPTCAYIDQITCPPCWRYTDYDARTPDAGKFSAPYRVLAENLRIEEESFGPTLSEGKTQMFFAGLCDSYAQPQRMYMNVIPDFNLRKLHTMNNDCGFELGWINYKSAKGSTPQKWSYKLLAFEYIYGNTAHLFGNYHGAPLSPLPDYLIRSYFLIQPAQKYYALTPVKDIFYNVNGKLGTIEDAIANNTLSCNQVKIVYTNGLEVAANLNDSKNFEVVLHGKKYILPPEGFAASLPGKLEAYSALNQKGKRADLMKEGNLIYIAGNPDIAEISAQGDYTLRFSNTSLELTPAPFKKAEQVTLQVPFAGQAKVIGVDRKGKKLTENVISVNNGNIILPIDGKVFRYLINRK